MRTGRSRGVEGDRRGMNGGSIADRGDKHVQRPEARTWIRNLKH